jgi:hypothetical protein
MSIFVPQRYRLDPRRVPDCPVRVIESHPLGLAGGLVYLCIPTSPHGFNDICNNGPKLAAQGTTTWANAYWGRGTSCASTGEGLQAGLAPGSKLGLVNNGSLLWAGLFTGFATGSGGNNQILVGISASGSPFDRCILYILGSLGQPVLGYSNGGTHVQIQFTGTFTPGPGTKFVGCTFSKGASVTTVTMWPEGYAAAATQTNSTAVNPTYSSTDNLRIGLDGGSRCATSAMGAMYNTALSTSMLAWGMKEPFCMVEPVTRRFYVFQDAVTPPITNFVMSSIIG